MNTDMGNIENHVQLFRSLSHTMSPLATDVEPCLQPLRNIRCVLFDIYGTLLMSGSGDIGVIQTQNRDDAFERALDHVDIAFTKEAGRRGRLTLMECIKEAHVQQKALGADYPEVEIREIWRETLLRLQQGGLVASGCFSTEQVERCAVYYEATMNPVWPMPGVPEILDLLRAASMLLGIVSNAQFYTPLAIQALCGKSVDDLGFESSLCCWSYQILRAKPGVTLFAQPLEILRRKGISAEQVVYVGNDMLNDITAAQAVGCRTVLFAGDRRSLRMRREDDRCVNVVPDATIIELAQLKDVLL